MTFYLNLFEGNIIRVTFPFSPEALEKVKQFSIRNWNQDIKCWEIPLRVAHEIPSVLDVEIPQKIKDEYNRIYTYKPVLFNPSLLRPEIIPYPFQRVGIEFLASHKNALLSDEVGLGKTLQSISAALHLNCKKVLVICPASVKRQWSKEIEKFTTKTCQVIDGTLKQREQQYRQDCMFFIVNYELILKDLPALNSITWDMIIADEVSRIKNFKSKTKSAILQIKTNYKLGLSATPIENSVQELHSIMSWINPDILGTYWNFINEYCYYSTNLYGGYTITGIKDAKKLHEALKNVMIRRKKMEVFTELPEIVYNNYYIPLSKVQKKMYEEIEKNIMNLVQKEEMDEGVLNQIMYLRELCNSPRLLNPDLEENGKVTEVVEIVKQFSTEHKIVIFSQWTKMLDLISEGLLKENIQFVQVRGDINQDKRDKNIIEFNTNENIRILLSSDAGNMGLNLQVADVLIHCDLLWNYQKMQQRNGRVHRIGQKNIVNIITILTENTIEEKVYKILQTKKELFDKIIEGKDIKDLRYEIIRKIFKDK